MRMAPSELQAASAWLQWLTIGKNPKNEASSLKKGAICSLILPHLTVYYPYNDLTKLKIH